MGYKKWIIKCIIIVLLGIAVYLPFRNFKQDDRGEIIAIINGENIYQQDYLRVKELNENLSDAVIIEIVMKEFLVYQEAEKVGITVLDEDVENRIINLRNELPDLYELCVEQYGSEKEYKQALYYSILYEKMFEYISDIYLGELIIDEAEIKEEIVTTGFVEDINNIGNYEINVFLKNKYRDEINDYFKKWNNDVYQDAKKIQIK